MDKQEAIKILKEVHDTSALFSVRTALETVFPELKEGEDEKIRKTLIEYFNAYPKEYFGGLKKSHIIAWLEKHGEQKEYTFKSITRLLEMIEPSDRAKAYCQKLIDTFAKKGYNTDAKIVEEVLKGWNGEDVPMAVMDEQKETICDKCKKEQPSHSCQDITALGRCALEKQGEQKPVEWNERDERVLTEIINDVKFAQDKYPQSYMNQLFFKKEIDWLKSLKQRIGG